ncbi:stemmadenine O-acetyltransferase [Cannabis sativa]|uniref:stemmadenine O-acetyltransferase n=1 Tax=Cannabis sativa TaxID=3483 RepID=UPI0029CA4866|nr:stemmadenine O-acetyltransferase [Cannabis sativa]
MELKIVSSMNIKPSCPTPSNLRIFKLSLLDQLIPQPYAPIVLFYLPNDNNYSDHCDQNDISNRLESLRKSLSSTLTRFYPLAGKFKDQLSIECNDEGANYVETQAVGFSLRQFLSHPGPDLLLVNKLLPCQLGSTESNLTGAYVANIQVNVFDCGGIALGLCIAHKILDGVALSTFIKSWAAEAQGFDNPTGPNFVAGSLFPADDSLWLSDCSKAMFGSLFSKGKSITKRFVFNSSSISILKSQSASSDVENPTRVEAVSGFLWRCFMTACKEKNGVVIRPSLLNHIVNLRRRTTPYLPENSIGNLVWMGVAKSDGVEVDQTQLVSLVRESTARIDDDFVKRMMRGEEGKFWMMKWVDEIGELGCSEGVDYMGVSSWCRIGFYEADFGWGRPIWVSSFCLSGYSMVISLVILVDTRSGDGIEAWVSLDEDDMAIVECNTQLLQLAQVDPSPLELD